MPTWRASDDAPVVQFDPALEVSPFALFRRLRSGTAPRLVDIRQGQESSAGGSLTLEGAEQSEASDWSPNSVDEEVVLFDDHGDAAVKKARELQEEGYSRVRALFGGLDLYEFSLDPEVVGSETFLIRR